ncbi:hypothetical protein B0H34DRAFT_671559 [Crassisporium funariophilum]|nr:hypothetical protein B0H34DRAFT_671559 [Crassisporium funariophilum]
MAKRRQSALFGDAATVSVKRSRGPNQEARPSGAVTLHGMNERLDDFTDVFHEAFTGKKSGVEATPSQKMQAMQHMQELETTLSDECIVALIDLFQADVSVADVYLSISRDGVRKAWVAASTKHVLEGDGDRDDLLGLSKSNRTHVIAARLRLVVVHFVSQLFNVNLTSTLTMLHSKSSRTQIPESTKNEFIGAMKMSGKL